MADLQPGFPEQSSSRIHPNAFLTVNGLLVAAIIIAALHTAREVLIPVALAMLLSFALLPIVVRLQRLGLPRLPSVVLAVLLGVSLIGGLGALMGSQFSSLAQSLPQYQSNITAKIRAVQQSMSGRSVLGQTSKVLRDLSEEIEQTTAQGRASGASTTVKTDTVTVQIREPELTPLQLIQAALAPLLAPLATAGIVIVFVVFFLLQRDDISSRFIRLMGTRDLHLTTRALDDATERLSRYLLTQGAINAGFGLLIGVGLWIIGIPNPALWGILSMLLRFIPYIGPIIALLAPSALALAIDPGWSTLLWTLGLFIVVEPLVGHALEPVLYGRTVGLSPVAIVVAATFWTWLWGPIGLLLAMPLTLCLVVVGRHVKRFAFLEVILGDQPPLTVVESYYHRMFSGAADEASQEAEAYIKAHSLAAFYDDVALQALVLAQNDVNRGVLEDARRAQVRDTFVEVVADLREAPELQPAAPDPAHAIAHIPRREVLCIAGRGALDEAAATILGHMLEVDGALVQIAPKEFVGPATLPNLDVSRVGVACLSYLEAGGFSNARYLIRRLRRVLPNQKILVAFWSLPKTDEMRQTALDATGADGVVTSLAEAQTAILQTLGVPPVMEEAREPVAV